MALPELLEIGHITKACKSKAACLHCGKPKDSAGHLTSIDNPKCTNCKGNHSADQHHPVIMSSIHWEIQTSRKTVMDKHAYKLMQLNVNGLSKNCTVALNRYLQTQNINLLCSCETKVQNFPSQAFPGMNCFLKPNSNKARQIGVALQTCWTRVVNCRHLSLHSQAKRSKNRPLFSVFTSEWSSSTECNLPNYRVNYQANQ